MPAAQFQVIVGSTNPCKRSAVSQALEGFPGFASWRVVALSVPSGVAEQPRSMEETLRGARNRARGALAEFAGQCSDGFFGVGLESGVFEVGDRMFDVCACVILDGEDMRESVGFGPAFEIPPKVVDGVRSGMDLTQASFAAGLSSDPRLGEGQGLIGVLSEGRVDRLAYTKQAVAMAMVGVRNHRYSSASDANNVVAPSRRYEYE